MLSIDKNNSLEGESMNVASVSDYFELLKPRVMSLAIFTAIIGLLLAPGSIHPMLAIFSIIAIGAGAGAAGAINMWYDKDIDADNKKKYLVDQSLYIDKNYKELKAQIEGILGKPLTVEK